MNMHGLATMIITECVRSYRAATCRVHVESIGVSCVSRQTRPPSLLCTEYVTETSQPIKLYWRTPAAGANTAQDQDAPRLIKLNKLR
jgi:hypothetical protein